MINNFDFAKEFCRDAAEVLNEAEDVLYFQSKPVQAIPIVGYAAEIIVKEITHREGIVFDSQVSTQYERIKELDDKIGFPIHISKALHNIRRKRNDTIHENKGNECDARVCLEEVHDVLIWCMERYGFGTPPEYKPLYGFYRPFTQAFSMPNPSR
jgi:hypothetical protein